jgi:GT2 family glycosyltransferase
MVVRMSAISGGKALFDEGLPFYGWLEDVDFSRTLAALGDIVLSEAQRGVHLGIKSGRQPGLRLGYSQVANPIYLIRKGTMSWERALWLLARNLAMNLLFALTPEPFVDRAGRLRGNVKAIAELFTGELHPERIRTL